MVLGICFNVFPKVVLHKQKLPTKPVVFVYAIKYKKDFNIAGHTGIFILKLLCQQKTTGSLYDRTVLSKRNETNMGA